MEDIEGRLGEAPGQEGAAGWGRSQRGLPDVEELLILWIDEVRAENLIVATLE